MRWDGRRKYCCKVMSCNGCLIECCVRAAFSWSDASKLQSCKAIYHILSVSRLKGHEELQLKISAGRSSCQGQSSFSHTSILYHTRVTFSSLNNNAFKSSKKVCHSPKV